MRRRSVRHCAVRGAACVRRNKTRSAALPYSACPRPWRRASRGAARHLWCAEAGRGRSAFRQKPKRFRPRSKASAPSARHWGRPTPDARHGRVHARASSRRAACPGSLTACKDARRAPLDARRRPALARPHRRIDPALVEKSLGDPRHFRRETVVGAKHDVARIVPVDGLAARVRQRRVAVPMVEPRLAEPFAPSARNSDATGADRRRAPRQPAHRPPRARRGWRDAALGDVLKAAPAVGDLLVLRQRVGDEREGPQVCLEASRRRRSRPSSGFFRPGPASDRAPARSRVLAIDIEAHAAMVSSNSRFQAPEAVIDFSWNNCSSLRRAGKACPCGCPRARADNA